MDEAVLKKINRFLQTQTDNEATFSAFWDGTKCFYPAGQSKSKLKAWLKAKMKHYPGRFEVIKSETGDPFGVIKLKVKEPSSDLPDTTWAEDAEITTKLIEFIDNTAEGIKNGHLYSTICTKKALVFPEKLQDKKYIRLWLIEHENLFKVINDPNNGGLFALEVKDEARNLNLKEQLMAPAAGAKKASHTKTTPKKAKDDTAPVDLYKLADNIVQRISEKVKNAGGTIPIESLLKARDVIAPLHEEDALNTFLTKFPEKFELIDLEGIGKWVHLKGADKKSDVVKNPVSKVTSFIFKNGGTVPFGNLLKEASALIGGIVNSSDDLLTWLSYNANNFEVIPKPDDPVKPWQVKVKLGSFPRFCQHYFTQGQCPKKKCQFLHMCKAYVCQRPHEFCNFSHNIRDEHNKTVIDRMGVLSKETDVVVLKVLLKSCFPRVCTDYNKDGVCPRGDNCHFLHVCGNYILNLCENTWCSLSHNVIDGLHNINVLKKYTLLPSQKLSLDIVKTNIAIAQVPQPSTDAGMPKLPQYLERMLHGSRAGHYTAEVKATTLQLPQSDKGDEKKKRRRPRRRGRRHGQASSTADDAADGVQRQVSDKPKPLMDVDLIQKIDNQEKVSEEFVPNICLHFLIDQCCGKKCPDVHFPIPYCWQFNTTGSWHNFNTNDCEMIEKYFCDVNCAATELNISTTVTADVSSVRLDFQSMSGHPQPATGESFKIRRLQCEQSGSKHDDETWYETKWLWYELKSSKWIKYYTAEANVFERLYLKGSLPVDWSTQRRRPASFLTKSEVKKKKRSMKEQQKLESTSSPPPQSPASSHPPLQSPLSSHPPLQSPLSSHPPQPLLHEPHRMRVEPGTLEYKEIEELFVDSTGQNTLVVNHIDKIVSDDLWEKYKRGLINQGYSCKGVPSTVVSITRFLGRAPGKKDTLNFEAGEEIDVLTTSDPEWWKGRSKRTGKTGFFPRNHVEVPEDRSHKPQRDFTKYEKSSDLPTTNEVEVPMDEVDLTRFNWFLGKMGRDEAKEILEKTTDGTFLVRERTTVPGQYALSLKHKYNVKHIKIVVSTGMFCLTAFKLFPSVASLIDYYRNNTLGVSVRGLDTCLTRGINEARRESKSQIIGYARVKYDYEAEDPREISIKKNSRIMVMNKDREWWKGENEDGQVGFFPSNFVKTMNGDFHVS